MAISRMKSESYTPPFTLNAEILNLVSEISEMLGRLSVRGESTNSSGRFRLLRANRIRSIQGSLAIEGNTLSEQQITAILEGKRVLAPLREIQEVKNALEAYDHFENWNPAKKNDLLDAHHILMTGLLDAPGVYRTGGVGVMKGKTVVHLAPPAQRVPALMNDLFAWLKKTKDHPLIASSVFHHEFEFIHPFADGNGRMGRLWQTIILFRWNPLFASIPVESLVFAHQAEYYAALNQSTGNADSSVFIEFMLKMIRNAIADSIIASEKKPEKTSEKILKAISDNREITIAEMAKSIGISPRSIERNLKALQSKNLICRIGPDKGGHWEIVTVKP